MPEMMQNNFRGNDPGDGVYKKDAVIAKIMRESIETYLELSEWYIITLMDALRRGDCQEINGLINKYGYDITCFTNLEDFMLQVCASYNRSGKGPLKHKGDCFYFGDQPKYMIAAKLYQPTGTNVIPLYRVLPEIGFDLIDNRINSRLN